MSNYTSSIHTKSEFKMSVSPVQLMEHYSYTSITKSKGLPTASLKMMPVKAINATPVLHNLLVCCQPQVRTALSQLPKSNCVTWPFLANPQKLVVH